MAVEEISTQTSIWRSLGVDFRDRHRFWTTLYMLVSCLSSVFYSVFSDCSNSANEV